MVGNDTQYEELQQHIMNATVDDLKNICDSICENLPKRNGYVVCHNKILSSLMRCNTAVYNTSSLEASIAITMYLTTYFTKKKAPIQQMLSTLCQARKQIEAHPSSAHDSGTSKRTIHHFFQRTLNSLDVAQELSDTQVAASLCGVKSFFSSDIYSYLDVWTANSWVMHEHDMNSFHRSPPTDTSLQVQGGIDHDDDDRDDDDHDDDHDHDSIGTTHDESEHIDLNDDDNDGFNDQSIANGKFPETMYVILAT